jgi:AcrR family transcriptional regulator
MPRNKEQSEQMRAESQEKILATAQRLFADHGYNGCSVADIAHHAGMSKANIYWYYASKEELLGAVLMKGFEILGSMMAEAAASSGTGIEKLAFFIENYLSLSKEQGGQEFITIVFNFVAQGGPERFSKFGVSTHQIGASYHQALNAILEQGQVEGSIIQGVTPDLLSTFFFSLINGMIFTYPEEWKDIPTQEVQDAVFRLFGVNLE